ncbi:hypothetical protein [Anditalea andensis]|uniref:Lipoprotein n=1 Tax=Anditalea andensis TaxID=1048983 RepID=A0A074L0M0_9BACT|nr:hypothetical protein [Anditalea andensis]KEO74694.1 hypothetical protein EL17_03185 [Anditalea andensis]
MKANHLLLSLIIFSVVACNDRREEGVVQEQPLLEGPDHRNSNYPQRERRHGEVEAGDDRYLSERGGSLDADRVRTAEQRIRELKASHADMMQEHRRLMDEHRAFWNLDRDEIGEEAWQQRYREIEGQQARMEQEYEQMMKEHELMRDEHLRIDEDRRVEF